MLTCECIYNYVMFVIHPEDNTITMSATLYKGLEHTRFDHQL